MYIDLVGVCIFVNLFLHVSVRDVATGISSLVTQIVRIDERRCRVVERPDCVDEQRSFLIRDPCDISPDSISECHDNLTFPLNPLAFISSDSGAQTVSTRFLFPVSRTTFMPD
jgi:hypothetical protein